MGDSNRLVASESSRSRLFTAVSLCEWEKGGCGTRSRLSHVNEGSAVGRGGSDARRLLQVDPRQCNLDRWAVW